MTPADPTPPRGVSIVPESDQPLVDARQDGAIAHLRHRQLWAVALSIVTGRVDLEALRPIADGVRAKLVSTPTTPEEMTALVELVRGKLDDAAPLRT